MALGFVGLAAPAHAGTSDGALRLEVITAHNFVVDSNVESPSSVSPSSAHLGVKLYNDGATALTNVQVRIGDLLNAADGSGTPGVFPSRTVTVSGSGGYSGTFALQMPGGAGDAVRTIPRIEPGEYVAQYFFVTYPLKDGAGNSVAGAASVTDDDLWLNYDVWVSASEGATTRRVDKVSRVTMRNEISAMANKIWPNTDNKVPPEYLAAVEQSIGWRPETTSPTAGAKTQLEGVWYDLGNVGAGFDNDGDGLPDRNAWLQPVGNPNLYDPLAVRLVGCHGLVIVKLNDGTNQLIPFRDQLYFENIPGNNNGAVGLVFYEFVPLGIGGRAQMTPYQEVASGFDNEKFNSDYGASVGGFSATAPALSFDKTGPVSVTAGNNASYALSSTNTGTVGIGFPELSLPLVFEDEIPTSLVYVAGSASSNNTIPAGNDVTVNWSTDHGVTWQTTEPAAANVNRIRWTLSSALNPGATATVCFQAQVPSNYLGVTVDNTGIVKLGPTGELSRDLVTSFVSGINSIGDLVWKDDNRNSIKDAAESGIANVKVDLYYDANGNGALDTTDIFFATTQTNASGIYGFANLPDGNFLAVVDSTDADLPAGCSLPTSVASVIAAPLDPTRTNASAVDFLTADWPFIGALEVVKSVSPSTYGAGSLVTYTIDLENHSSSVASNLPTVQTAWAPTVTGNRAAQFATNAQGNPDSAYARIDWAANADNLSASGQTFASTTGTITKVEVLFNGYVTGALTNDVVDVNVNGALFTTLTTAQLNTLVGPASDYAINVTSLNGTWTWAQVQALTANFIAKKVSSADGPILWMDSIGVRVTTSATPPSAGTYGASTLDPLPLVDSYDATKLQYVSATVTPSSVVPGTITWSNLGPLNAGSRNSLTVTFRALAPPDTNGNGEPDSTTHVNTATSTGAKFVSGRSANTATSTATITIQPRGQIGDTVFWDINANGTQDVGEPGLANVLVTLSNGAQARTDSLGKYLFTGLANDTYTVTVTTTTLPWTTFTQTKDPDATKDNASTVTINLNDGSSATDSYLDRDFGYDSTLNVISGSVFTDNNGDGDQDAGEASITGLTVTLLRDADSNGSYETTVTTTTTNTSGFYQFTSLANGLYRVVATAPANTIQTLDPDLAPGVTTGDNATNENASGGNLYPDNNFAYKPTGTLAIGDTLYVDWNGDGDQDAGEGGIANVDVFLYEDANGNGAVDPADDALVATSVTNASGVYGFSNLPAATWVVVVNTADPQFPANVLQIQDFDGVRDSRAAINLTVTNLNVDFGYKPQGAGSIGDIVFGDQDGDGVYDAQETGISGVAVALYEDSDNNGIVGAGDALVASTTTNASGGYLFTGIAAGNYLVDVDQVSASIPKDAFGNTWRLTTTDPHDVTLAAGQAYLAADFGFAPAASIGDFVFFDDNANGTQDWNETGIPGVTVQLFADANKDGQPDGVVPLATTVTANGSGATPAGFYQFANLPAGTYFVKVLTSTLPQSSGLPIPQTSDPDRDGVPVWDSSDPGLPAGDSGDSLITVMLGSTYTGADFGYQPPGSIGDFVWLDVDKDGIQDPGEPGIAGVTVSVTDGSVTYNATTDYDGYWTVSNLTNGAWTVSIPASNFTSGAALEHTVATYDADGSSNSSVALTLTGGNVNLPVGNLGLDFGYALTGSYDLSGTVVIHDTGVIGTADDIDDFFDDGIDQDAGPNDEIEFAGVAVYLYTTGGDFLGSTVTDAQGNYSFTGLPPGGYRVIIGTTASPLDRATLTTTVSNNVAVSQVNATSGTSVIQTLTIGSASVSNVDFAFISTVNYDYGDLPGSYGITTLAQDGARHVVPAGGATLWLGSAPDVDTNGRLTALADGDDGAGSDDEDGITAVSPASWTNGAVSGGHGGQVLASVHGSGWLCGWIDWNGDGDFLDAGEWIASQAVTQGNVSVSFDIPAGAIVAGSQSWLSRFRLFESQPAFPLFSYSGEFSGGEVEDHLLEKPVGGSIGDLVWIDEDGDGVLDATEAGIGGVRVELRNAGNTLVGTQFTSDGTQDVDGDGVVDPAGYYRFRGLGTGTFTVTVATPPAGYTPSYDENGIGTPSVSSVTLAANEQHLTADYGYKPMVAAISGQVRYDIDADGNLADADNGAPFIKVQLWTDPNGDGDPSDGVQVGEGYTDDDGNYLFTGVPTGRYVVVEINLLGATSTADVDGGNPDRIAVALAGVDVTGRDFLDTLPPLHLISGSVFKDNDGTNDNVIASDDIPIPSVQIKLFYDRDGSGTISAGDPVLATTFTAPTGAYFFGNLPPGSYLVQEIDPAGGTSEWDAQGLPVDNLIVVSLANQDVTARDFLDDGPIFATLSGHVFDGTTPIPGVTLTLLDSAGNPVDGNPWIAGVQSLTTVTDGNGYYVFRNLPSGTYLVSQSQPSGYLSFSDLDGGDLDVIGDVTPIEVAGGDHSENNDFIEALDTCANDWPEWLSLHPGENASGNPDGDVLDNLAEFAFARPYDSGAGSAFCIHPSTVAPGTIEGGFVRPKQATNHVTYVLEYAAALGNPTTWQAIVLTPDDLVVTDNGDCTESVVIFDLENLTGLATGEGFIRIRAELDENGDETIDHVSHTPVEGWTRTPANVSCRTYNNPYLHCAAFSGTIDSATGSTLTLTTSAGPVDLSTVLQPGVSYYAEITSGDNEGHRFDVVSGSGGTLTVANDSDLASGLAPFNTLTGSLPVSLAGDGIVIRPHWTLDELFPPDQFGATGSQATADQVQVNNAGIWTIYWLYDDNGTPRWVKDATLADEGGAVLPPGQGIFFNNRQTTGSILAWGEVRANDFIRPLAKGSSLVGGGYPLDQSAMSGRAMTLAQGFFGSRDFKKADRFYVWKGDAVTAATGYDGYFFLNGAPVQPSVIQWTKTGDVTIQSHNTDLLFQGDRAVFMDLANPIITYELPTPWTP